MRNFGNQKQDVKNHKTRLTSDDMKLKAYKNAKRHYGSKDLSGQNDEMEQLNLVERNLDENRDIPSRIVFCNHYDR